MWNPRPHAGRQKWRRHPRSRRETLRPNPLADFAKIVDMLDAHDASFVSVSIGGGIRILWAMRFDAPPNARPQPSSHNEVVGGAEFIGPATLPTRQAAGGGQRPVAIAEGDPTAPGPSL